MAPSLGCPANYVKKLQKKNAFEVPQNQHVAKIQLLSQCLLDRNAKTVRHCAGVSDKLVEKQKSGVSNSKVTNQTFFFRTQFLINRSSLCTCAIENFNVLHQNNLGYVPVLFPPLFKTTSNRSIQDKHSPFFAFQKATTQNGRGNHLVDVFYRRKMSRRGSLSCSQIDDLHFLGMA